MWTRPITRNIMGLSYNTGYAWYIIGHDSLDVGKAGRRLGAGWARPIPRQHGTSHNEPCITDVIGRGRLYRRAGRKKKPRTIPPGRLG